MEQYKSLYKEQRSQTPHHKRINRELLVANRNKQRNDRFQSSRNLSSSPVKSKEIIICLSTEDKEYANENKNPNTTRLAKLVCSSNNSEKLSKQEAALKRFVLWREKKKQLKQQEALMKKKPFVSAVRNGGRQTATSSTLVPKGHHKDFCPPVGLKNPLENQTVELNKSVAKGRQSTFTVVPTPPKKSKHNDEKQKKVFPIARKALQTNIHTRILNSNKAQNDAQSSLTRTDSKTTTKLNRKIPADNQKTNIKNSPTKSTLNCLPSTTTKPTAVLIQPVVRSNLRPRALKMPPPPPMCKPPKLVAKNLKENKKNEAVKNYLGASGKIKAIISKRSENVKQTKRSPLKNGGAHLAQNLKAKKPLSNSKKISVPNIQANGKNMLKLFKNNIDPEEMVLQTPKDFSLNPFAELVTSTKLKDSGHNVKNKKDEVINHQEKQSEISHEVKKFNFMMYSEVPAFNDENNACYKDGNNKKQSVDGITRLDEENKKTLESEPPAIEEKTPMKAATEEKAANYLSPFVSVSRGKVSLKKEKEKRNSIYMQNGAEINEATDDGTNLNSSKKYSLEVRRTLEAVGYFRKQLKDEIDRLHKLCDVWESYKTENLEKIQNANGEDMINVTIGQTRLLTSKKFMQFKGLINRCEAGATGVGAVEYDGSENTKPITSEDLEGFWSMLGLQVDNLDKRFENLNRWKQNEWIDPDEAKPKIKKNLTKVKKAKAAPSVKARPNSALQQMLRKMQAEMRKNKCSEEELAVGDNLTPSKRRRSAINRSNENKSLRRSSIVVKDRKYYSPAATVISVSSSQRKSQDSPKIAEHVQKFHESLDNLQTSFDLRKSVLINGGSRRMSCKRQSPLKTAKEFLEQPQHSPNPVGRKSILKTPGTANSKQRNVIFNEKLRVKKFNFLIDEDVTLNDTNGVVQNVNESHEEDLPNEEEEDSKRILTLRNRKVRLRPSCEIVIPFKQ